MAMPRPQHPYVRESGSGPVVICLHANASASGQWRALGERLADRYTVLAPDLWSAGRSPVWEAATPTRLDDELVLLESVFARCTDGCHLVGHSYGGAVALKAALRYPDRVRSLVLYEPTAFWLVMATERVADVDGIRQTVVAATDAIVQGHAEDGARLFIDFWSGPGAWARIPVDRRPALAEAIRFVSYWAHALMTETTPMSALESIAVPALVMNGTASPLSGRAPAALLAQRLPNVTRVEFPGLGHMGPVTDPDPVNAAIAAFLDR